MKLIKNIYDLHKDNKPHSNYHKFGNEEFFYYKQYNLPH